eukprot:TRINITY_DN8910_c0_g1_i2.p1 TRINITY_DN8910_c0_g1~~TRINITY_DN8910_c0_g1_i2.p1  ORF type:complete len:127 (-),score=58.96 TRINITY_DN8910_c0_g1_i2:112-492(-)
MSFSTEEKKPESKIPLSSPFDIVKDRAPPISESQAREKKRNLEELMLLKSKEQEEIPIESLQFDWKAFFGSAEFLFYVIASLWLFELFRRSGRKRKYAEELKELQHKITDLEAQIDGLNFQLSKTL